jgi:hypothetical protein
MRMHLIATARTASKGVIVGGLAAVSFAVTGVALAAAGSPLTPAPHSTGSPATHAPATGKPAVMPTPHSTHAAQPGSTDGDRACPWPTPAAVATPHDNGLHCGWYKPGHRDGTHPGQGHDGKDNSSARPHPTGNKGAAQGSHGTDGGSDSESDD